MIDSLQDFVKNIDQIVVPIYDARAWLYAIKLKKKIVKTSVG